MIDIRKLKELVRLMVENDLSELDLQDQQETVTIKRGGASAPTVHYAHPAPAAHAPAPSGPAEGHGSDAGGERADAADTSGLVPVESPMVGTFYSAANPDSPAFVSVGAQVGPDTTVCLIEAMKVFNEIKAETSGVIERILVENGQPVEYGQKLFLIKPNGA